MWSTNTYWFDFSLVSLIFAIGNMLFGHFEEHTPKWRKILKYALTLVLIISITHYFGRGWSYGLLGVLNERNNCRTYLVKDILHALAYVEECLGDTAREVWRGKHVHCILEERPEPHNRNCLR